MSGAGIRVNFEKWEGLGNDFILLEHNVRYPVTPEIAQTLCDRRRGIGGDGVLVVECDRHAPPTPRPSLLPPPTGLRHSHPPFVLGAIRPRMTVFNADGSRPEMCGNGIRCVAAYLVLHGLASAPRPTAAPPGAWVPIGKPRSRPSTTAFPAARTTTAPTSMSADSNPQGVELVVSTDAGERHCVIARKSDADFDVNVEMGSAHFENDLLISSGGWDHRFMVVDVGNPHAVTFDDYNQAEIDRVAPVISAARAGGLNVEFARIVATSPPHIDVTVWERGVGRTLACGTGACAVVAAACHTRRSSFGTSTRVTLPGGELEITVPAPGSPIQMRGPARRVFSGEFALT